MIIGLKEVYNNMKKHEIGVERMESKKTPNKELLDTLNTNQSFSFSENGLAIQSDERSIKIESWSVEQFENWINKQGD